jgi:hypothetical protein
VTRCGDGLEGSVMGRYEKRERGDSHVVRARLGIYRPRRSWNLLPLGSLLDHVNKTVMTGIRHTSQRPRRNIISTAMRSTIDEVQEEGRCEKVKIANI